MSSPWAMDELGYEVPMRSEVEENGEASTSTRLWRLLLKVLSKFSLF